MPPKGGEVDVYLQIPAALEEKGEFIAVLDTGAQSGVCGEKRWAAFQKQLEKKGLKPVLTNLPAAGTRGIGGSAQGIGIYNVPVALGGACGIMTIQVIRGDIPFLISVAFQRAVKMRLDLGEERAEWLELGTESKTISLPSGHVAVNILDCHTWTPPICPIPINITGAMPKFTLLGTSQPTGSSLGGVELTEVSALTGRPHVGQKSSTPSTRGMPDPTELTTSSTSKARSGCDCRMVETSDQPVVDGAKDGGGHVSHHGLASQGHNRGNVDTILAETHPGCNSQQQQQQQQQRYTVESDWRSCMRKRADCIDWEDARCEPKCVPSSLECDDRKSECQASMVHLQGMREEMGEDTLSDGHHLGRQDHGLRKTCTSEVSRYASVIPDLGSQRVVEESSTGRGSPRSDGNLCNLVSESARGTEGVGAEGGVASSKSGRDQRKRYRCHHDRGGGGSDLSGSESSLSLKSAAEISPQLCREMEEAVIEVVGMTSNHTDRGEKGMKSVVLGLYTTQGMGVTKASFHPSARRLLDVVHRAAKGLGHPYWAVTINYLPKGTCLKGHKDMRNWPGTRSFVYSFGQYSGGALCQGDQRQGNSGDHDGQGWTAVDPRLPHGVETVRTGERWSVVLYVPGRLDQVTTDVWNALSILGFPKRQRLAQRVYHRFLAGGLQMLTDLDDKDIGIEPEVLKSWGYEHIDQRWTLSTWTDLAAEDGHGEHAADVKCLAKHEKSEIQLGAHVVKHLGPRTDQSPSESDSDSEDVEVLDHDELQKVLDQHDGYSYAMEHADLKAVKGPKVCMATDVYPSVNMEPDYELDDEDPLEEVEDGHQQWTPSASELQAIRHVHANLGHPTNAQLSRMMKHAGARTEVARWVRRSFMCDACQRLKRPAPHLPAKHPATYATNQIMSLDTIFIKFHGEEHAIVHAIDWGTSYVQARVMKSKTAKEAFKFWCQCWVSFLGVPKIVVTDAGSEFTGAEFRVGDLGAHQYVTDAKSPWQNGRCERSGKELKRQLTHIMEEVQPEDLEDFENCIAQAILVKNQYSNHAGFSPLQRLFGYAPEVLEALTQAAQKSPLLWEGPQEAIKRSEYIRECAVRAWIRTESRARLLRASRAQHQRPMVPLQVGQHVRIWRQPPYSKGQWVGPAQVLAITSSGAFISIRGVLWKVSRGNIRVATDEEEMAQAVVERFMADLKMSRKPGIKRYLDCTRDPYPPDEEEDDAAEANVPPVATSVPQMPPGVEHRPSGPAASEQGSDMAPSASLVRQDTVSEPEIEQEEVALRDGQDAQENLPPVAEGEENEEPPESAEPMIIDNGPRVRRQRSEEEEGDEPVARRPRTQNFPYPFDRYEGPFLQEDFTSQGEQGRSIEDWWEDLGSRLIRHHVAPRRRLFHPVFEKDEENPMVQTLSEERVTVIRSEASGKWSTCTDLWEDMEIGQRVLPFLWTGETHFTKKPDSQSEEMETNVHQLEETIAMTDNAKKLKDQGYCPVKGVVQVRMIPWEYAKLFHDSARRKEANAIRPSITPLTPQEAEQVQAEMPERIMATRWLDVWKEVDESSDAKVAPKLNIPQNLQSKSRWIIKGFSDPDFESMHTDAPTPELAEITLCLQVHCSMGWVSKIGDIKAAFNQSDPNMRAMPVYAWLPEGGLPADDPLPEGTRIVRLEREVYGLLTGPAALRCTILDFLKGESWLRHPLAPCVFSLYSSQGKLVSLMLLLVDDILIAGEGRLYEEKLKNLQNRFHWGKWETLMEGVPVLYAGREVIRHRDGSVTLDISKYVHRIEKVEVQRGREKMGPAHPQEVSEFRRLLGVLIWAGRAGCYQILGSLSLLASRTSTLKVQDIHEANRVLYTAKKIVCPIIVRPVPIERMLWVAWSDASLGNAEEHESQAGFVLALADCQVLKYQKAQATVTHCHSHKLARVAGSSLMAETLALSETLAALEYWQKWLEYVPQPISASSTQKEDLFRGREIRVRAIDKRLDKNIPRSVVFIDNKGLHDTLRKEASGQTERRVALECAVIKDTMARIQTDLRWLPHDLNVADSLTKLHGHGETLQELLQNGHVTFYRAQDLLKSRAEERETLGYNPRPKRQGYSS
eukprot:5721106-Amphidinium_carterae.1